MPARPTHNPAVTKPARLRIPKTKPRNPVVRALVRKNAGVSAGRHVDTRQRRLKSQERRDLNQRIREIGD